MAVVEDKAYKDALNLGASLSAMELPWDEGDPVTDAFTLMDALVQGADGKGRYFANPMLLNVIPWSRGGAHNEQNFQTLCMPCNMRKGAR